MGNKKGERTERELFHMFWKAGWPCIRSAGSGRTPQPSPDLLAGSGNRKLAIECKSTNKDMVYLTEKEITELEEFSKRFGSEAIVGIRFNNWDWRFLNLNDLERSNGGNFSVSKDLATKKGLNFDKLIRKR